MRRTVPKKYLWAYERHLSLEPARFTAGRGASRLASATSVWRGAAPTVIAERGTEYHLLAVVVIRSRVRINHGGPSDGGYLRPQVGNRAHARDHGAGPRYQVQQAMRPHVQPGVLDVVCVVVGVQGCIEDDISRVVHVELPAAGIAGCRESSSSWHRIVRARHRNGLPARMNVGISLFLGRRPVGM
jgi:hypothetical protein